MRYDDQVLFSSFFVLNFSLQTRATGLVENGKSARLTMSLKYCTEHDVWSTNHVSECHACVRLQN